MLTGVLTNRTPGHLLGKTFQGEYDSPGNRKILPDGEILCTTVDTAVLAIIES